MRQIAKDQRRPPSMAELQKAVTFFNSQHPVGTPVTLRKDSGEIIETRTRSAAAILGGHSPVVWLDCDVSAWHIDRVAKIHHEKTVKTVDPAVLPPGLEEQLKIAGEVGRMFRALQKSAGGDE